MTQKFAIRDASKDDAALILQFIRELAVYEKLEHQMVATETDILKTLFDGSGRSFCMIADTEEGAAGFALGFYNYSTFQGKYGIYLEDVFVRPEFRGRGIGKAFFQALAQKAEDENCGRMQWSCLDWNEPSLEFYRSLKAVPLNEWVGFRLEGETITNLAKKKAA